MIRVRPMTADDAAHVAELAGELGYPSTAAQIHKRLETLSGDRDSMAFVAEADDAHIAGWAHVIGRSFLESEPYAELAGLVVASSARRAGVGKALVSAVEDWAKGRGYLEMRVRSNVKRVEARPFYEGLGFVITKSQFVYHKILE